MTPRFGVPLTPREQWVLELVGIDGLSMQEVASHTGSTVRAAWGTGYRIRIKLGARSMAQAVNIAMGSGVLGTHPKCGTRGGVARHERGGTPLCVKCRVFYTPYRREIKRRAREQGRAAR
jgi:DNA-binding CsgD family transcriptional regulator